MRKHPEILNGYEEDWLADWFLQTRYDNMERECRRERMETAKSQEGTNFDQFD